MSITEHAGKAIVGALAGAVIGWTGAALTTVGRVDAIERTLSRIEARLDTIADKAGAAPARQDHASNPPPR